MFKEKFEFIKLFLSYIIVLIVVPALIVRDFAGSVKEKSLTRVFGEREDLFAEVEGEEP